LLKIWKRKKKKDKRKMNQNKNIVDEEEEEEEKEFWEMNEYKNIVGDIDYDTFTYEYDKKDFLNGLWEGFIKHLTKKYNLKEDKDSSSTLVSEKNWKITYDTYSHPQCQEAEIEINVFSGKESHESKYLYLKSNNCDDDDKILLSEKMDTFVDRILKNTEEYILSLNLE
jgi:hypothetical protein